MFITGDGVSDKYLKWCLPSLVNGVTDVLIDIDLTTPKNFSFGYFEYVFKRTSWDIQHMKGIKEHRF